LILNDGLMKAIPELSGHVPGVEMSHEAAVGKIDQQEIEYLELDSPPEHLYRGKGCDKCLGKGYLGRTGIYELLEVTPEIRSLIGERTDAQAIGKTAAELGFKPMHIDGIDKIIKGVTTIDEVLRVTHSFKVAKSP